MAFDGIGAYWIVTAKRSTNPYLGKNAKMWRNKKRNCKYEGIIETLWGFFTSGWRFSG